MPKWECRDINSCLHCPYPDCIRSVSFRYPPKKKIIKVTELATGICREFDTIVGAGRGMNISYSTIQKMVQYGKTYNGYIAKRVEA